MIQIRKYKDLHHFDHGWLKGVYHFSFADYYDLNNMGFGALRVVNDDTFQPQNGLICTHIKIWKL
jgi:redox-sensitive bicupin YhaK (pirin superfamily)